MGSIVAKNHRLHRSGDGQFHTVMGYQCLDHKLEEAFSEGFFAGLWTRMRVGDEVRIFEMKDGRVMRMCEAMVIEQSERKVLIVPIRPEIKFDKYLESHDMYVKKDESPTKEPHVEYAKENGTVKWNPGSKKYDVMIGGERVAKIADKNEAEAIAYGQAPIPA